ncbi:putative leucine-rich repeat-containing protein DDB_G0290503 isoform X2 [Wyeomyia smithii]|uniref:putative leucine-rich repeat-containing protein DDB_G0290503 isoform X2 n=1 Tax=Wyeomyia smithii TaxID=174621 RepID=UPI002467D861|nr:putative leucine-rich repeat-containing protein DDB_G0290503 isoform X2 [Wyeomyia smithii]
MARNAMLSRMETICAEAMEIQEIFLDDDDDLDEEEVPDDIPSDADDDDVQQKDEESDGKSSRSSEKQEKRNNNDKGVSVKVNCEDKKQQRYAKWISRALRAAVNPIVSRFNLNLKVNLDLNLANKGNANKGSNEQENSKQENVGKPTPEQSKQRADLARIKALQKENKRLEAMFTKIVAAYSDMKTKLTQKTTEMDDLQLKVSKSDSNISQLLSDNSTLKAKLAEQEAHNDELQTELKQLQNQNSSAQNEINTLEKQLEKSTNNSAELRKQVAELQQKYDAFVSRTQKEQAEHKCTLDTKQAEIAKLSDLLKQLEEEKQMSETKFHRTLQAQVQKNTQLELRNVELMQRNRELSALPKRNTSETAEHTTAVYSTSNVASNFTCPLCGTKFAKLGDLQIHTENCGI